MIHAWSFLLLKSTVIVHEGLRRFFGEFKAQHPKRFYVNCGTYLVLILYVAMLRRSALVELHIEDIE